MNDDRSMPLRQWALEYMGWKSAGQAYKAYKDGRLLLDPNPPGAGVYVMAEASRLRYEQTAHPGFRRRGAAAAPDVGANGGANNYSPAPVAGVARAKDFLPLLGTKASFGAANNHSPATPQDEQGAQGALDFGAGAGYQDFKAHREKFAALREEANYRREIGEYVLLAEVIAAFSDYGAQSRAYIEAMPAQVGPQVCATDEASAIAVLRDYAEHLLTLHKTAAKKLVGMYKGGAAWANNYSPLQGRNGGAA